MQNELAGPRSAVGIARLTQEPEIPGLIPNGATFFCFPFRRFKKGSGQVLAKCVDLVLLNRLGDLSLPRYNVV